MKEGVVHHFIIYGLSNAKLSQGGVSRSSEQRFDILPLR